MIKYLKQMAYISDEAVMEEQTACRKILQKLNFADRSDFDKLAEIVEELLGKSDDAWNRICAQEKK